MNLYTIIFLVVMLPFAFFSIKSDIEKRKVSNVITFSFLYISFLCFVFFLTQYKLIDFLIFFSSILLSFLLYKYNVWGAADGKIFMGIIFLFLAFSNYMFVFNFLLNLVIFYTIIILLFVIFKTDKKYKIKVFKDIDFGYNLFYLLILFIFLKPIVRYFLEDYKNYLIVLILIVLISYLLLQKINNKLKKIYSRFNINLKISLIVLLLIVFFLIIDYRFIYIFLIIYVLKIVIAFFSNMTDYLKTKNNKQYHTPFSIFLFIASIFTIVIENDIISIILLLFR
jgi:Flp pilus assembly protein protease CpaA